MKPVAVGKSIPIQQYTPRPGETIVELMKRIDTKEAEKDSGYAARLEMERRRAETSYAVDHDLGGD